MFDSQITEPIFSKYMHKKRACCMEKKKKHTRMLVWSICGNIYIQYISSLSYHYGQDQGEENVIISQRHCI